MQLQINGRNESIEGSNLTIEELLKVKQVPDPDMVSVQLNGEIVERDQFAIQTILGGDELEFLYFMGGGQLGRTWIKERIKR